MDKLAMKKQIAEQKLKAFSIGSMGSKRALTKKEQEDLKKKEQEAAAAQAFEEFVATFQDTSSSKATNKVWVKAGTYDAGKRREDTSDKGKLYKPQSRLQDDKESTASKAEEYARLLGDKSKDMQRPKKKTAPGEKKKSNLEMFKEELKMIQEEREERHKYKGAIKGVYSEELEPPSALLMYQEEPKGSFDSGDPCTTNLYLGNLNPKISEQQLMEVFGRFGPLASIKIMWPRSDEEKARGRNCGFVAFMNRKDGERALKNLNGKDVHGYEMKLGWGKSVPIPSYPIYIPPKMAELTVPPAPSGLPFNAQPATKDKHRIPRMRHGELPSREDLQRLDEILYQAYVKVVVPTDRTLLMAIHRMVEYVVREGPMFEAIIMNKEISNPLYRFLFENQSPAHVYYRWKVYSILQGDQPKEWRCQDFRMFEGGSIWKPPPMNLFTQGMPDDLVEEENESKSKGTLSMSQRYRLESLLRHLTPERVRIAEAMIFCMEHSDAADEICECIMEALSNEATALHKKIARLYLVSDILHNCGIKISNASYYRRGFESRLFQIFTEMHTSFLKLESRLKAEGLRTRVMKVFRAWEDWAVYPKDFLIRLQNIFLGLSDAVPLAVNNSHEDEDLDGAPLSDADNEDLDGVPLDGAALMKMHRHAPDEEDIDGVPLDGEDLDGIPMKQDTPKAPPPRAAMFVPSKWETVEDKEEEGLPLSKWEEVEEEKGSGQGNGNGMTSSRRGEDSSERIQVESGGEDDASVEDRDEDSDERRAKLREVEVKVMQYQDELESGRKSVKSGWTMSQQVQHYRKKLLRKAAREEKKELNKSERVEKKRSPTPASPEYRERDTQSRNKRRGRSRSNSRSPVRKSRRSRSASFDRSPRPSSSSRSKGGGHRSAGSPPPPRSKHSARSPSPPPARHKRRHQSPPSPSPSRHRKHSKSPPPTSSSRSSSSKHSRYATPSPPPPPSSSSSARKHKHKHKY